jgi:uncharacterized protein (TIGR03067 family)
MQVGLLISFCLVCFSYGSTKKTSSVSNKLDGTWIPVKQELGGTPVPATAFATQKLIISDTTYTFTAESVDKGVLKYDNYKMDIHGKEGVNAGKHFTAIYKFTPGSSKKAAQLTICYNLSGNGYPETFDTKGNLTLFLSVFKKE